MKSIILLKVKLVFQFRTESKNLLITLEYLKLATTLEKFQQYTVVLDLQPLKLMIFALWLYSQNITMIE
jgi:hypothetical protein